MLARRFMNILGIAAYSHDASAALVCDGQVLAAAQEDRFGRDRGYAGFPTRAARYCLDQAGLRCGQLDAVVFYDKPGRRFDRLVKTQLQAAPASFVRFVDTAPSWIRQRAFFRSGLRTRMLQLDRGALPSGVKLLFSEHHLSNAALAWAGAQTDDAAILTMDGAGEWSCVSMMHARKDGVEILREQHFPHSPGMYYSAFSRFLGFPINSGEYRLMALSAYGDESSPVYRKFREQILSDVLRLRDDGSFQLNLPYFRERHESSVFRDRDWERLFGMKRRRPDEMLRRRHAHLALAAQRVLELVVLRSARYLRKLSGSSNLCFAGGVALNAVVNSRLEREKLYDRIWIPPAPGDSGSALGAALAAHFWYFGGKASEQNPAPQPCALRDPWLGPSFSDAEATELIQQHGAVLETLDDEALYTRCAALLDRGAVIGWFQGRMEFGPRALGNRNVFADPRNPEAQRRVNIRVKYREAFRPLSAVMTEERAEAVLEHGAPSPYMSYTRKLRDRYRRALPWNYPTLSIKEKLHTERSDFPAVTTVDMALRVQTVRPAENPRLHALLEAFYRETECPMLATTSFNMREKPLVCTPQDAYAMFMACDMDYLVIGNLFFDKSRQPAWDLAPLYNI